GIVHPLMTIARPQRRFPLTLARAPSKPDHLNVDTISDSPSSVDGIGCFDCRRASRRHLPDLPTSRCEGSDQRVLSGVAQGEAFHTSARASTSMSISASLCTGEGVSRSRSVPRGTVG